MGQTAYYLSNFLLFTITSNFLCLFTSMHYLHALSLEQHMDRENNCQCNNMHYNTTSYHCVDVMYCARVQWHMALSYAIHIYQLCNKAIFGKTCSTHKRIFTEAAETKEGIIHSLIRGEPDLFVTQIFSNQLKSVRPDVLVLCSQKSHWCLACTSSTDHA